MSTKRKYQHLVEKECRKCHAVAQAPSNVGATTCPQCSGTMFTKK